MSNAKQVLLDLTKELQGHILSDTFNIDGREYEMTLLNEEETAWSYGLFKSGNMALMTLSSRTATLSIGVKSIAGCSIEDLFNEGHDKIIKARNRFVDKFDDLSKTERKELEDFLTPYEGLEGRFLYAKVFYEWLCLQPSTFIGQLHDKWTELKIRRDTIQSELKNSSRESSEKDEKTSLTDLSQSGEESVQSSE